MAAALDLPFAPYVVGANAAPLASPLAPQPSPPAPAPARPVLRVVPTPPCAPPYDDDPDAPPLPVLLPVLLRTPGRAPLPDDPWDDSAWLDEERTPTAQLPDVAPVAHALVQGLAEVLAGARPLRLFRLHLDVALYSRLSARLADGRRRPGPRPQRVVASLHVQARPEGVAEVCGTLCRDGRYGAVALRLEGFEGRWVCTELQGL